MLSHPFCVPPCPPILLLSQAMKTLEAKQKQLAKAQEKVKEITDKVRFARPSAHTDSARNLAVCVHSAHSMPC